MSNGLSFFTVSLLVFIACYEVGIPRVPQRHDQESKERSAAAHAFRRAMEQAVAMKVLWA